MWRFSSCSNGRPFTNPSGPHGLQRNVLPELVLHRLTGVRDERFCIFSVNDQQVGRTKKGCGNPQNPNWGEELELRNLPPGTTNLLVTVGRPIH